MKVSDEDYSKRKFMAGSTGLITGSLLSDFLHIKNSFLELIGLDNHKETIEVTLFQTDEIADMNKKDRDNEEYSLILGKKYLKQELNKLSDSNDFSVKVNLSKDYIPTDKIKNEDKEKTMENWRIYYDENIDNSEKSRDSNILLSHVDGFANTRGFGEFPCSCRNRSTVGIIFNADLMTNVNTGRIIGSKTSMNHLERSFSTLLHEVGHNLGFTHDMGYAWHDEDESVVKVTPMMSDYFRDTYGGKENRYGDLVVDVDDIDTVLINYMSELNPKIKHTDVNYERI